MQVLVCVHSISLGSKFFVHFKFSFERMDLIFHFQLKKNLFLTLFKLLLTSNLVASWKDSMVCIVAILCVQLHEQFFQIYHVWFKRKIYSLLGGCSILHQVYLLSVFFKFRMFFLGFFCLFSEFSSVSEKGMLKSSTLWICQFFLVIH